MKKEIKKPKITQEDIFKKQMIYLAKEHRKKCSGEECGIHFGFLMTVLQNHGILFNQQEAKEFAFEEWMR
jgi:hypothetical protein